MSNDDEVITAQELERMDPAERHRVSDDAITTYLTKVSPEFLRRVRAKGRALMEARGAIPPNP